MKNIIYFLTALCFIPTSGWSAQVTHNLNVKIGIFDAARVQMTYNLSDEKYAFSSGIETAGLFSSLYPFQAEYSTNGIIKKSKLITQDYHYKSKSSNHTRTKQLVFNKKGILNYRLSSKNNNHKRVDIELPDTFFDANDLQTVFASLTQQFKQNNFCALEKTVFDGKKNYKVTVKDEGKTTLQDIDIPYSGEAWKCSMYISRLDSDDGDMLWEATSERPVNFWIMKEQKSQIPFLAKIEIDSTPLGQLKAYTTNVTIKD